MITGSSGFVGSNLQNHYRDSRGEIVYGFDLRASRDKSQKTFLGEITDDKALLDALKLICPDLIFHLAGLLKSNSARDLYLSNTLGTVSLLEAVMKSGFNPRVIIASSSAVYGTGSGENPISERSHPEPITHYAASKLAQEIVSRHYFSAFGLPVINVRTFNLLGPGLSVDMAPSSFAKQIALAEKYGGPARIFTGDLRARRDYLDVRDAVRVYALIADHGKAGQTYNVCSEQAVSIQYCLDILLQQTKVDVDVVFAPERAQTHDIPVQVGSAKKIQRLTGWRPEISIKQSLTDLLNSWREIINMESVV